MAASLAVYLLFIGYQSLAGTGFATCSLPLVHQGPHLSFADGIANLVAYVPLGMLVAAWGGSRRGSGRTSVAVLLVGLLSISAFSLTMETLQSCLPGRVSSWYDWATNSTGGLVGLLAWKLGRRFTRAVGGHRSSLGRAASSSLLWPALLCLGAWLALYTAPWRFTVDLGTIRGNLAFLQHLAEWPGPDPWRLARHFSGWLAIGVALRALWPERGAALRALALLVGVAVIAQVLLAMPSLSVEELAGMALALVGSALVPALQGARLARALPVLALIPVAAYQLAPHPGGAYSVGFQWWPQLGRGGLLAALELALLFCWLAFALVLSLRWSASLGEAIGRRRVTLPVVVALALLLTEFAQHWIPGRTPDTSAPVITLLAFVVAWVLTSRAVQRPSPVQMSSTRRRTASSMTIGRPHSRKVSPDHLLVASIPILEPRPDTGEAKSR